MATMAVDVFTKTIIYTSVHLLKFGSFLPKCHWFACIYFTCFFIRNVSLASTLFKGSVKVNNWLDINLFMDYSVASISAAKTGKLF